MRTSRFSLWLVALPLLILGTSHLTPRAFGAAHAQYTFTDYVSNPLALRRVIITPIQPFGVSGNNVVIGTRQIYTNDASGVLIVSNIVVGFSYRVEFVQTTGTTVFTNCFDATVSGLVDASDYLCSGPFVSGAAAAALDITLDQYVKTNEPSAVDLPNAANEFVGLFTGTVVGSGTGLTNLPRHTISDVNVTEITAGTSSAAVQIGPSAGGGVRLNDIQGTTQLTVAPGGVTVTNLTAGTLHGDGRGVSNTTAIAITNGTISFTNVITEKIFNVKAFGAVGDGVIVNRLSINSNSTTITCSGADGTFDSGMVGKRIMVYFANTNFLCWTSTVATVVNSTNITIASAVRMTYTNAPCVIGTDDTAAIQAAINYMCSNSIGGELYFPTPIGSQYSVYVVAGPFQDSTGSWTNHHYAQLVIPPMPPSMHVPTIRFRGQASRAAGGESPTVTDIDAVGAVLWSFAPRAPTNEWHRFLDCRNFVNPTTANGINNYFLMPGGYAEPLNAISPVFQDITIRGAWDNNMAMLALSGTVSCEVRNVAIDTGLRARATPQAPNGANGFGLTMSSSANENKCIWEYGEITGYYHAIEAAASVIGANNNIQACVIGVATYNCGGNENIFLGLHNSFVRTNFFSTGCFVKHRAYVELEYSISGWWDNPTLIHDTSGVASGGLSGEIFFMFGQQGGQQLTIGSFNPNILRVVQEPFVPQEAGMPIRQLTPQIVTNGVYATRIQFFGQEGGLAGQLLFKSNRLDNLNQLPNLYKMYVKTDGQLEFVQKDGPNNLLIDPFGNWNIYAGIFNLISSTDSNSFPRLRIGYNGVNTNQLAFFADTNASSTTAFLTFDRTNSHLFLNSTGAIRLQKDGFDALVVRTNATTNSGSFTAGTRVGSEVMIGGHPSDPGGYGVLGIKGNVIILANSSSVFMDTPGTLAFRVGSDPYLALDGAGRLNVTRELHVLGPNASLTISNTTLKVDGASSAMNISPIANFTNGIATLATNIVKVTSTTGWTNNTGRNMQVIFTGSTFTAEFYNAAGAGVVTNSSLAVMHYSLPPNAFVRTSSAATTAYATAY